MLTQPKSQRPSSARPPAARPRSPALFEPENRSISIGIACTILFHVLLLALAPFFPAEKLTGTHSLVADAAARAKRGADFNIELANPEPPAEPDMFRFVETNPDAPENEPDKTSNVSDRNQQSAQPEKPPEIDPENRPSVKGRDDIESNTIVSGERAPPQPGTPMVPLQDALEELLSQTPEQARAQQIPLPGIEKAEGESEDGVGTNISRSDAPTTRAAEEIEGLRDAQSQTGGLVERKDSTRQQTPRERPRLASSSTARMSPLQNRVAGTANVGVMGIDARWSDFGVYMRELIDIVDAQWHRLVNEYRGHIPAGSRVVITFTLNADGEVSITQVEETAGRVAVGQCQTAITSRMPYRKWTPEMISVLGDQQTLTFSFHYY